MNFLLSNNVKRQKRELLKYFRSRASESIAEAERVLAQDDFKEKAKRVNRSLSESRATLITAINQKASIERWSNTDLFEGVLMTTYCSYVAMLEARHSIWAYEYMSFSRRIGELWEPFCRLPFEYPANSS